MMKNINKAKIKRIFFGLNFTDGLIYKIFLYILLITFSYIYLYPLLFMGVTSIMGVEDLINQGVRWVPTSFETTNYRRAFEVLNLGESIFTTTGYVLQVSIAATMSSALIGYGFARYEFPLKKTFFVLMLTTFILPPQLLMVAQAPLFNQLGLINTIWSMVLPALFGQGINQAIFILIFYQFFRSIPKVLNESAEIDGASQFKVFYTINLPLAIPSIVIVFLFAFVWYWNDTFMVSLYARSIDTLPIMLQRFRASYETLYPSGSDASTINEGIIMAGNVLTILPLLVLYFVGQRQFTQSIDKTGITGE